ncbi:MAG: hypothetical protein SCALA702_30360 [Melioribacteraceae bacterium]|nr:MAG: hypothetical protein SCALA702_30360 [Melioribacteraceae bacterium]
MFKHLFSFFLVFFIALTININAQYTLNILHHNDGESQLINAGAGIEDFGGVARFATLINNIRTDAANNNESVVLLTSGDNFLASPEFNASLLLPDNEPYYDVLAYDYIDYDAICLGNHDFDFGPEVLEKFISDFSTNPAPFLSANLDFSNEPALQALYNLGRIAKSTVVEKDGRQIGIVGATTPNLPFISSPGNVIVDPDYVTAIQTEVNTMTSNNIDIVIVISHLQSVQEDSVLASQLQNVDIMIAGGGDEILADDGDFLVPGDSGSVYASYPIVTQDANNNDIYIVTTAGDFKYLGYLKVDFDASGNVTQVYDESRMVRVAGGSNPDSVASDPYVQTNVIDPVNLYLSDLATNIIANSEVGLDGSRPNIRIKETNLGNLCADALFYTATEKASQYGVKVPDVAIQNGGGIRNNNVLPAGNFSELYTFDVLPFANFVTTLEDVPATQFKEILENCVSNVEGVSGRFGQISGFTYVWNPSNTAQQLDDDGNVVVPGNRVYSVMLDDGTPIVQSGMVVPGAPDVTIATINFLATGGDQYPFRGHPYTSLGVVYQRALYDYIVDELNGQITAAMYPEGGEGRIVEAAGIPVELVSFTASVVKDGVELTWKTATETNNLGFEIERSSNGGEFTKIAFVDGNGTSSEVKEYNFVDEKTDGVVTYRLKQVDLDGTFSYSSEVEVDLTITTFALGQNYPNPFNPSTMINFATPVKADVSVAVYNMLGEKVADVVNAEFDIGSHEVSFNASSLTSGVYFYTISISGNDGSSFVESKKMMLLK